MACGVENAEVIDLVGRTKSDECVLIMIDDRPWDGSSERLLQLQDKLNAYLNYVVGGRLVIDFPEMKGLPVRFQLDTSTPPDEATRGVLGRARELLRPYGITDVSFQVR